MTLSKILFTRPVVFLLASLSFACLLGEFYNLWPMRAFACWALLPATALLIGIAIASQRRPDKYGNAAATWIIEGALGGVIAACAYDLFRVPFVLSGFPLFKVFPMFGQMLLGTNTADFSWPVQVVGWTYHFSNGAALGIMFLAMLPRVPGRFVVVGAVLWAMCVEAILLMTPYATFFKIAMSYSTFIALTVSAHLIFGVTLGWWCRRRLAGRNLLATV